MKIKWNWGIGLFIAGSFFMVMILGFVFFMFQNDVDLVEKDYYPQAIEYQQKIDKTTNSGLLAQKVLVESLEGNVYFKFPASLNPDSIYGTILFYRPSEEKRDVRLAIDLDKSGIMSFTLNRLVRGHYIVKFDYYYQDKGYYQEESFIVQ